MAIDLDVLDSLSRDELIDQARNLGARRPEVLTRVELRDEIIRLSEPDAAQQKKTRGWLGVARDLVASVVESGLNMRDAAALIRGEQKGDQEWHGPPPVATVTLAEIYVAQGHPERALTVLEELLEREPDHVAARALRERLQNERAATPNRRRSRVPEAKPDTDRPPPPAPAPAPAPAPEPAAESAVAEAVAAAEPRAEPPAELHEPPAEPSPAPAATPLAAASRAASAQQVEVACVLVQQGATWLARWQAPPDAQSRVLRVLALLPRSPEPEPIQRDVALESSEGSCEIAGLPANAVVRAALGRTSAGAFSPLAVAAVIGDTGGGRRTLYRPPGQRPSTLEQAALVL